MRHGALTRSNDVVIVFRRGESLSAKRVYGMSDSRLELLGPLWEMTVINGNDPRQYYFVLR